MKTNPADKIEQWELERLTPYARNSRTHSDAQVAQLAASIREWGWTTPVLVSPDGGIIAGHGRVLAARQLGMAKVPVVVAEGWSEAKRRAYVIADNKLAENAGWDSELLALELGELGELGFDLELTGFSGDEIAALSPAGTEGLTDPDEIPEPPATPVTKTGDLWLLGDHRVLCGDSTNADDVARLVNGAKAQMMFTDPPYGVNYEGGHFHSGDVSIVRKREKLEADSTADIYSAFLPVASKFVDGACYIWFAGPKSLEVYSALKKNEYEIHSLLIWNKTNATYAAMNSQYKQRHEPFIYCKPKGSTLRWCGATTEATVWDEARDGINEFHPTQKPVALAAKAIRNHEADSVLDLFLGSGTTLIAAEQLGRKCYGMEISPAYCDVIVKRWETLTGKTATLST